MGRSRKHGSPGVIRKTSHPPDRRVTVPSNGAFSVGAAAEWVPLALILAFSLLTLCYPAARAFYRFESNYNEGWNVYNALAAMQHAPLYSAKCGWTTVNYPLLSFYFVGYVSHLTGDYLLTGRLISLVALLVSCVLVGLNVKKLTGGWKPALFAGAFCLGLFCSRATDYVATDDPQMFAHVFFLSGLWLYLGGRLSTGRIAGITSLFALGGNIKQSPLSACLAVFSDLFITSKSKALQLALFGLLLLAVSIVFNTRAGGPFFISQLLLSTTFSFANLRHAFFTLHSPLGLPLAFSAFWSVWRIRDPRARTISLYFFWSVLTGLVFGGGSGIGDYAFFDIFFAMSIIMGDWLDILWKAPIPSFGKGGRWRFLVPVLLYLCLALAFVPQGTRLRQDFTLLPMREKAYIREVSFLVEHPGPAVCESLIMCYDAGKPFIFDPYNATRLVRLGKLDSNAIVQRIAARGYAAFQLDTSVDRRASDRFPEDVLYALDKYYYEALKGPDCYIYLPHRRPGS